MTTDMLDQQRQKIDELDRELVTLLNRRVQLVTEVARLKRTLSLPVADPARENAILERLQRCNGGPLDCEALQRIYQAIFVESRRMQQQWQAQGESVCIR